MTLDFLPSALEFYARPSTFDARSSTFNSRPSTLDPRHLSLDKNPDSNIATLHYNIVRKRTSGLKFQEQQLVLLRPANQTNKMATSCGHDEAGMRDKVESLLECSVCLEPLNDPRTLPCFHSFCKVCLEKIVHIERKKAKSKIEDFNCPTCRSVYNLKSNQEVADLSCSHFIRNMLEAVQLVISPCYASRNIL